jgi:hypothetical protein
VIATPHFVQRLGNSPATGVFMLGSLLRGTIAVREE